MKKRAYLRILFLAAILTMFYLTGLPWYDVILLGAIFGFLIFLRGKLNKRFNEFIDKRIHFLSKLPDWTKKIILIVLFLLFYLLIKELLFLGLKNFGVDVHKILAEEVNRSLNK